LACHDFDASNGPRPFADTLDRWLALLNLPESLKERSGI